MDFGQGKYEITSGIIFANHLERRPPRLLDQRHIEVALLVGLHLGFADRLEARAFEKTCDRVIGRADARALLFFP